MLIKRISPWRVDLRMVSKDIIKTVVAFVRQYSTALEICSAAIRQGVC